MAQDGIDAAAVLKLLSTMGGSKNLAALRGLLVAPAGQPETTIWAQLIAEEGIDAKAVLKLLAHGGGSKNLAALRGLFEAPAGQLRCRDCSKQFNERTGTPYNYIEYPTEVVTLAAYLYYRFRNRLDNVVELMAIRGFYLSHQSIYNWVHRFGVELAKQFRKNRKGKSGAKWHVDPTYIRIEGRWCYLYRAIDKEGNLVDVYLSDVCDQAASERFFMQAENTPFNSAIYSCNSK